LLRLRFAKETIRNKKRRRRRRRRRGGGGKEGGVEGRRALNLGERRKGTNLPLKTIENY